MAVAGQLEFQRLGADRVESAEYPVLTAEPGLDFLQQMQGPLVLAANEVALCGGFKPGHPCLGISAHELRAVNVQGEQYAGRKLLEAEIALQRLDRITARYTDPATTHQSDPPRHSSPGSSCSHGDTEWWAAGPIPARA